MKYLYTLCFSVLLSMFSNGVYSQCNDSYYFVANSGGGCGSYFYNNTSGQSGAWDFDDGNTSSSNNGTHDFVSNGTYYVSLTIGNCIYNDTVSVTCHSNPCDSLDNYYITPDGSCGRYYYNNFNNDTSLNTAWDFGNGDTSITQSGYHTYATNGTYYTTVTVGSCVFNDTIVVSCHSNSCDSLDNYYITPDGGCGRYYYNNFNNDTSLNTAWDFGNGDTSIARSGYYTYTTDGTYYTTVTIGNCVFNDTVVVSCNTNSTKENEYESGFSFFPNPVKDVLNIQFNNLSDGVIEIYSYNGKKVGSKIIKSKLESIEMNSYLPGVYFIRYIDNNGSSTLAKRFIKH